MDRPAAASWAVRRSLEGQRVEPAEDEPPGSPAGGDEFGAGPLCEGERAAAVGEVESAAKRLAAFGPVSRPPEGCPQVGHGAGVFQPCAGVLENIHRLAQQLDAAASALGEAGRAQRYPERARAVERLGEGDLLGGEHSGFGWRAEREVREGCPSPSGQLAVDVGSRTMHRKPMCVAEVSTASPCRAAGRYRRQ